MRVAHIINSTLVGGAERSLLQLLKCLYGTSVKSSVITLLPKGPLFEEFSRNCDQVIPLGLSRSGFNPWVLATLGSTLRSLDPHVVVTWMYQSDLVGGLVSRLTNPSTPVVWNTRTGAGDELVGRTARAFRRGCSALSRLVPSRIVCNSPAVVNSHFDLGYDKRKLVCIPNGFDCHRYKPDPCHKRSLRDELGVPESSVLIAMIGRRHAAKDHESFVQASIEVCRRRSDVHIVMCGEGVGIEDANLVSPVIKSGLDSRFHLLGLRHDMPRIQAAIDVGVLMSNVAEGFPNAVGEAMACGSPCIVSRTGGSPYVVGDTGKVVEKGDAAGLAMAMHHMISLPLADRESLSRLARHRIVSEFSAESMARRHVQTWYEACDWRGECFEGGLGVENTPVAA